MTQERQPIKLRKALLSISIGETLHFPQDREESVKATASQLKRKGLAKFKTKLTDDGIIIKRIENEN